MVTKASPIKSNTSPSEFLTASTSATAMSNITSIIEQAAGVAHRNESVTVGALITSLSLSILVLFVAFVVFWSLKDRDLLT